MSRPSTPRHGQGADAATIAVVADWPSWLPRRLLTVEDLAEILQVSTRTVRRMIDSGEFPRAPLGRLVRVPPEAVLARLTGQNKTRNDSS